MLRIKWTPVVGIDIEGFEGPHRFLSNFHPSPIRMLGHIAPTVEHAYQAAKYANAEYAIKVLQAKTPGRAKRMGQQPGARPEWDEIKDQVMFSLVRQKFMENEDLCVSLLDTDDRKLIEGNTWGDIYWGVITTGSGQRVGLNKLGIILMTVRSLCQVLVECSIDLPE